jgi:hypothetical protein
LIKGVYSSLLPIPIFFRFFPIAGVLIRFSIRRLTLYRWLKEETRVIRNHIRDVISYLEKAFSLHWFQSTMLFACHRYLQKYRFRA